MKREMKLICMILAYVEQSRVIGGIPLPEFDDYRTCDVEYHVNLCDEAGYLDIVVSSHDKRPVSIHRMTWQGHEALESLRKSRQLSPNYPL